MVLILQQNDQHLTLSPIQPSESNKWRRCARGRQISKSLFKPNDNTSVLKGNFRSRKGARKKWQTGIPTSYVEIYHQRTESGILGVSKRWNLKIRVPE